MIGEAGHSGSLTGAEAKGGRTFAKEEPKIHTRLRPDVGEPVRGHRGTARRERGSLPQKSRFGAFSDKGCRESHKEKLLAVL